MASTLEKEFAQLKRIVEKYCREDKREKASEFVIWAQLYTEDFPQQDDIDTAISFVKKAEKYILEEGKPHYEYARDRVVTKLLALGKKKGSPIHDERK